MGVPVVIPQGENPITSAIKYAGDSMRSSIQLMNQARQVQAQMDANRITAGKSLLEHQWNMFDSLSKELGPEVAWDKTRMGFASAYKFLGMDDTNVADFESAMTSGPISIQGMKILAINRYMQGNGSFSNQPAGDFSNAAKQQTAEAVKQSQEQASAKSASTETTTTSPGTLQKTYDEWTVIKPTPPVAAAGGKPVFNQEAAGPLSTIAGIGDESTLKYASDLQAAIAATKDPTEKANLQAELQRLQPQLVDIQKRQTAVKTDLTGPKMTSGTPSTGPRGTVGPTFITPAGGGGTGSSSAGNAPMTWEKTTKGVKLIGPMPQDVATPEAKATWISNYSQQLVQSGLPIGIAGMFSEAAATIPPTTRTSKTPSVTLPEVTVTASSLTPPVEAGPKPPSFPAAPPAGFVTNIKPYMDDSKTASDATLFNGYKSFYEYWAKTQAGIDMQGSGARVGANLANYINSLPSFSDRVSDTMTRNYVASFDPSGKGNVAAGLQRMMASFNVDQINAESTAKNAEANMIQAKAQAAGEAALDKPFTIWDTQGVPGADLLVGKWVNLREYGQLVQITGDYIRSMAASGVGGSAESTTYLQADKYVQEEDAKMWTDSMKTAKNDTAQAGVFFEKTRTERLARVDSYFASKKVVDAYNKKMGWKGVASGKDIPMVNSYLFGLVKIPIGSLKSSGEVVIPEPQPQDQTAGTMGVDTEAMKKAKEAMRVK
jgi:hypothetical protein